MHIGLNKMKNIYNKFLIISALILFLGGSYLYFSKDLNSGGIISPVFGSSLDVETSSDVPSSSSDLKDKIASDISFLTTLVAIKNIKIDGDFFNNKPFKILKNNSVVINPVQAGRPNPFNPIGVDVFTNSAERGNTNVSINRVTTEQPSQITSTSAILNGTASIASDTAPTYFEYSTSPQVSNPINVSTKQSLVGTFLKNITGLNPATTYYYKACVKINNVATCGEIVSFTTN